MSKKVNKQSMVKVSGKVDAMEFISKNGYPTVGAFSEQKDLQKFYKQLPVDMLEAWCKEQGLEYKACAENEMIHRMRVCMAILYKNFPKQKAEPKSKSKYASYTNEQLVAMAIDNDVAVEVTENDKIMRMRCIMALRASKIIE